MSLGVMDLWLISHGLAVVLIACFSISMTDEFRNAQSELNAKVEKMSDLIQIRLLKVGRKVAAQTLKCTVALAISFEHRRLQVSMPMVMTIRLLNDASRTRLSLR